MGCLIKILKKILIIALIIAFFALGGWAFLKEKINSYKNPTRKVFVEKEIYFGDFSKVSEDFQLIRNFNIFGYKKITAKYLPTEQKINIFDLNSNDKLTSGELKQKAFEILDKFKNSAITFENFEIMQEGNFNAINKKIPYIVFKADIKNIPFKKVKGVIGAYETKNKNDKITTKLIYTMVDDKAFDFSIPKRFVEAIEF